ncbi:MAG: hypothetical protein JSU85_03660 [Candidatus Zixiibacteriota bacterium]|nr:MAG: hypothetical protein JSU85_03660 [candidate division Zixibacteria bacterium]
MGLEFIDRVIKTTLIFALFATPFLFLYMGYSFGLSVIIGAVWGVLNLLAIKFVILSLVKPGKRNLKFGLLILFFKIPVLYGIGYLLLTWDYLSVGGLLWGFSGILIVSAFKGLSRSILKMDNKINPGENGA